MFAVGNRDAVDLEYLFIYCGTRSSYYELNSILANTTSGKMSRYKTHAPCTQTTFTLCKLFLHQHFSSFPRLLCNAVAKFRRRRFIRRRQNLGGGPNRISHKWAKYLPVYIIPWAQSMQNRI